MKDFILESDKIKDVQIVEIGSFGDKRGEFSEIFRHEWFPQLNWDKLQSNRSKSWAKVLRGLHYHFHQVDYWYVPQGLIRAALVDLRPHSPSYKASQVIEMGEGHHIGLFIPIGVAHGFYAVTDCTLIYFVNNYYDSSDEFGVAWNDPSFNLNWGNDDTLIISQRDANNPLLKDIPPEDMPKTLS
jgi:dTDP-4-dehydrorhamnose 3,5-epimerase